MPRPLDKTSLNDLALAYVARFATSGAKLEAYLKRKLRERGVAEGAEPPDVGAIVSRLIELRYVDDEVYAKAKAGGLLRRGYGGRRVDQALRAAGIDEGLREDLRPGEYAARQAVVLMSRKRGFGPYGSNAGDPARREKQIAALLRAGHGFDAARRVVNASGTEEIEQWLDEAEDGFE